MPRNKQSRTFFYVPIPQDLDLVEQIRLFAIRGNERGEGMQAGRGVYATLSGKRCLTQVQTEDVLYVLLHGRNDSPDQVGGIVPIFSRKNMTIEEWNKALKKKVYMSAKELAANLQKNYLSSSTELEIRLLACYAADRRHAKFDVFRERRSFAEQFNTELRKLGYNRVILRAYEGATVSAGINSSNNPNRVKIGGQLYRRSAHKVIFLPQNNAAINDASSASDSDSESEHFEPVS